MKLSAVLATIAPFLATDKKTADVQKAILAADKAAKDAAGSGLGSRELEEKDKAAKDKAAKDKAARDKAYDAMSAEEKKAYDAMSDEEKTAKDAEMCAGKDEDLDAEDSEDDPEHTNDAEVECGDPSTPGGSRAGGKTAIDSAEVDRRIARAVASRDALHAAHRDVEPILGRVTFDTAPKAYRAALNHLKVDVADVPDSALPAMLRLAKDRAVSAPVAMDSAGISSLEKIIPGYGRLK